MVNYDEFGPEKILEVHDYKTGMHGFTVIDNTSRGPAKGGIRMTASVSIEEVARLARTMTWKCSIAGLPFGGGKSGIIADVSKLTQEHKHNIIAAFSRGIKPICPKYYIAAPDINTAEAEMKVFVEANGSHKAATGKPSNMCIKPGEKCGIPHEYGSTGFGVFHATLLALEYAGIKPQGATVAIEGFGNVGNFTAKYLSERGIKIVALSDSKGCLYNENGLDYKAISEVKEKTGSVTNYKPGSVIAGEKLFELPVDILIPAALPNVINESNVDKIKARVIVEAANIPTTPEIEEKLHQKGVLIVPDFVANAGGVISSYAEYRGHNPDHMFQLVEKKIKKTVKAVLQASKKSGRKPRDEAMDIAMKRVKEAMEKKGKH